MSNADDDEPRVSAPAPSQYAASEDRPLSVAVVEAVAAFSGRSALPTDSAIGGSIPLDPLYESIDPDALDAICRPRGDDAEPITVSFTYCGYEVRAESTGNVTVLDG